MDNKIKVCFLIPSLQSGGIETYLLRFLKHQKDTLDATVIVRNKEKGELYHEYLNSGAKIVFKPLGYFNISAVLWYYRFFESEKFKTICDFNANFAGLPMFLGKLAAIEKRITFYRQGSDHFNKTIPRVVYNALMNRLVYHYSTNILANSLSGLKFFFPKEYLKDLRFKVIRNGVNIEDYLNNNKQKHILRQKLGLPKDKFIVGHTGRFTAAKNHFFLLDVVEEVTKQNANTHLVLIGNDTDKLIPYITKLGILEKCTVLGYKSNIPDYLKAIDLYFFPSITEGQPNALIEAMLSGLPIAASNIPSIIECLPLDRLDCLINPYNVETTVKKIISIAEDPENYKYQKFALKNFDAEIQFAEFVKNL